ncbi:hypothetical protein MOQ_010254 [Trypanosoma cruzi marinkellei]|uniref:WW domain-containing protein n=1 Tax=Trypanosoma cruzi marinkellei TaxID=85056 RepID=K2MK44_TRYCR|nr:hypothetical protein MOQ_010254 [Trypanosoma cruzi marinkellei]
MIHLFVDGDYFLSGMTPTSEEAVRSGVEDMLDAIMTQLFGQTNTGAAAMTVEQRIVFFSSSILKALEGQPSQRDVLITALRRLRFQTIVLDTISSRAGSPVDAAICTKTMSILAKPHGALNVNIGGGGGSGGGGGKFMTLVYFAANAYISSALEWAHDAGCGVCFVVYNGDSVADELMAYVSPTYGSGGGIATITKGEGINFIPNTGAASAALAALQHEGKELPLGVLMQLKQLQQRLTGSDAQVGNSRHVATVPGTESLASSLLPSTDASSRPHPPPIADAPDPFLPDDDTSADNNNKEKPHVTAVEATAPSPSSTEEPQLDTLTLGAAKKTGDDAKQTTHVLPVAETTTPMRATATPDVATPVETATKPVSVAMHTTPPVPHAPTAMTDAQLKSTTDSAFPEPEVSTRLPAGWTLMYDRQRRRHFFCYTNADRVVKTTWTHPSGLEEQMDLERQVESWHRKQQERRQAEVNGNERHDHTKPMTTRTVAEATTATKDWDECVDPKSGRKYYVNRHTKQTTWTLPAVVATVTGNNPAINAAEVRPNLMTTTPNTNTLPPFWEECVDPKSGRKFYVNHQTRETTWTRP